MFENSREASTPNEKKINKDTRYNKLGITHGQKKTKESLMNLDRKKTFKKSASVSVESSKNEIEEDFGHNEVMYLSGIQNLILKY